MWKRTTKAGKRKMQYLGGKSRIAKQLAAVIDQYREPGQLVWDAFCGGLSMSTALSIKGPVFSSDACLPLISLYTAVQQGWEPPTEVTPDQYRAAKLLPDTDPFKAFCGFGCSFGGKWFGGYAKGFNGPLTYPQLASRNVKNGVKGKTFACVDFLKENPCADRGILYLDPPYRGTTAYAGTGRFDHDLFVVKIQEWAQFTDVFVSEYDLPVGQVVWERASRGTLGKTHGVAHVERLYRIVKGSVK